MTTIDREHLRRHARHVAQHQKGVAPGIAVEVAEGTLALLAEAERLEAMVTLGRENWRLWHRDWEAADAKIQRVREVLYRHEEIFGDEAVVPSEHIRRALEGEEKDA